MKLLRAAKEMANTAGRAVSSRLRADRVREEEERRRGIARAEEEARIVARNREWHREFGRRGAMLAPEKERARAFVGIAFRGPADGRRAWVPWAGLDVWEIVEAHDDLLAEGRPGAESEIAPEAMRLALAYRAAYPEEIERAISENRRPPEDWHRLYPKAVPAPRPS